MDGFKAILRKVAYPKSGYFGSLDEAVDFAKRRHDVVIAWTFATCPPHNPTKHKALDPALKIAVRQLWDGDPTASQPAPEPIPPPSDVRVPPQAGAPRGVSEVPEPVRGLPEDVGMLDESREGVTIGWMEFAPDEAVALNDTVAPNPKTLEPITKRRRRRRKSE